MAKTSHKSFFLISFLPALAYWYLEEKYPVRIAVMGGLVLSVLELGLEYAFTRMLHALSKLNFVLILLLGALSLFGDDGIWFKLQPLFTGMILGPLLIFKSRRGNGIFLELMESMGKVPPDVEIFQKLEIHTGIFLLLYGIFMGTLAIWFSTSVWAFFKTAGLYITFFVFMIIEIVYLRFLMKRKMQRELKRQILSRF